MTMTMEHPAVVETQEAIEEQNENRKDVGLAELLKTYHGREFVWDVLGLCGIYHAAPNENMARFEGRRDIGLDLHEMVLTADRNAIIVMRNEHQDRLANDQRQLQAVIERIGHDHED